jgi:hypothetical protein
MGALPSNLDGRRHAELELNLARSAVLPVFILCASFSPPAAQELAPANESEDDMPTIIRPLSIRSMLVVGILCVIVSTGTFAAQGSVPPERGTQNYEQWLTREVGHQLIQVPWLSVFDNLQYSVKGSEVTLSGQVWQPVTKADAELPSRESKA